MKSPNVGSGQSMLAAANNIPEPKGKKHMLIAYHANCIDGFTAAWAVVKNLPKGVSYELMPMDYSEASYAALYLSLQERKDFTNVAIVDFSIPMNYIAKLNSVDHIQEVTILDHHKTALQNYGYVGQITPSSNMTLQIGKTEVLLDNSRSGAAIAWQFFSLINPDMEFAQAAPLPKLIKYVQDYDLWKLEFGEATKAINAFLKLANKTIDSWDDIAEMLEDSIGTAAILYEGGKELEQFETECVSYVDTWRSVSISGYEIQIVQCPKQYASRVGELLAQKTGTFGATYVVLSDGKAEVSLRSRSDVDVAAIAKNYGGGGHAKAAGFTIALADLQRATLGGSSL